MELGIDHQLAKSTRMRTSTSANLEMGHTKYRQIGGELAADTAHNFMLGAC